MSYSNKPKNQVKWKFLFKNALIIIQARIFYCTKDEKSAYIYERF